MKMDEVKSFVDLIENGIWMGKLVKITGEHSQAGSEGLVRNFIREEGEDNYALQVGVGGKLLPVESVSDIQILESELSFEGDRPQRTRVIDTVVPGEGQVFEPVVKDAENIKVDDQAAIDEADRLMRENLAPSHTNDPFAAVMPDDLFAHDADKRAAEANTLPDTNPFPEVTKNSPAEKVETTSKETAKAAPKPEVKKADSAPKKVN